jgi:hypothetical protein
MMSSHRSRELTIRIHNPQAAGFLAEKFAVDPEQPPTEGPQ